MSVLPRSVPGRSVPTWVATVAVVRQGSCGLGLQRIQYLHDPGQGSRGQSQRRESDAGPWHTVAGPSSAQWLVDSEAPSGQLAYRLVYRARDGSEGPPSAVVNVSRP